MDFGYWPERHLDVTIVACCTLQYWYPKRKRLTVTVWPIVLWNPAVCVKVHTDVSLLVPQEH